MRSAVAAALIPLLTACGAEDRPLLMLGASTTIEDTGLLVRLTDGFRERHPDVQVRAVTGASGQILALARRGDVDVALTHDPAAEARLVAAGDALGRWPFMRSAFLIAGPVDDPARVADAGDALDALARIAASGGPFVSRADGSGTHQRERALWRTLAQRGDRLAAQLLRDGPAWYIEAGTGMAEALRVAEQRRAYILTERATHALTVGGDLPSLLTDPARLDNVYAATVSHAADTTLAGRFVDWLRSERGRAVIRQLGGAGRSTDAAPLFEPVGAESHPVSGADTVGAAAIP